MSDDGSDAEQIKQSGWRQGSILSDDLVASLVAVDALPEFSEAGRWVVVSHDCDVTNASLSAEPRVELIFGERICLEKKDGNKEWGKNSRLLQVSDPLKNAGQEHFQFNAHHRFWIPRQCLIGHRPADQILTLETVHRLAIWLTKRYIRSAFPDEFNERTRPAVNRLRKKFKKSGDLLTGVYVLVEDVELATDEDYKIIVCGVMRDQQFADHAMREAATKLQNLIEAELDKCDGIAIVQSDLRSESQISLAELRLLKRWDFDDLTLRDEDSDAIPKLA
jgi:hypothetical protein